MQLSHFTLALLICSVTASSKINFIGDWGDCQSNTPTGPMDK